MTPSEALDKEFKHGDFNRKLTFREFFKKLLAKLFEEEEGFSGKHPFGNSGWTYDVEEALKKLGVLNPPVFIQQMIKEL